MAKCPPYLRKKDLGPKSRTKGLLISPESSPCSVRAVVECVSPLRLLCSTVAQVAAVQVDRLGVRTSGIEQVVQTLSGGNQQKVVVGRWLAAEPAILLMDEPTRGVDVGAREELYLLLERLAAEGLAVLFASSDMEELLRLADRVVVLHDGQVTGTLDRSVATEEAVMELATGGGLRAEGSTTT